MADAPTPRQPEQQVHDTPENRRLADLVHASINPRPLDLAAGAAAAPAAPPSGELVAALATGRAEGHLDRLASMSPDQIMRFVAWVTRLVAATRGGGEQP